MKMPKLYIIVWLSLLVFSCNTDKKGVVKEAIRRVTGTNQSGIPLDKGYSEYIDAFTSGIIPSNSVIEIRFTPEFAQEAYRSNPSALFRFTPALKGKAEWADETTLVFTPSDLLKPGETYYGELDLSRIGDVKERLKSFPLNFRTLKKDFSIITGLPETNPTNNASYILIGELISSDYISPEEVETYLEAKLGRKHLNITWDHSGNLIHKFTVTDISRSHKEQNLILSWDGTKSGIHRKNSASIRIPPVDEFSVIGVKIRKGENQSMDIAFSDPVNPEQELEGLIHLRPSVVPRFMTRANIVTLIPSTTISKEVTLSIEPSVKNNEGRLLSSPFSGVFDFTYINPSIQLTGEGTIIPSSQNLIFPFKAANLRAVDLRIIKIFGNNLPWFLQEYDISTAYSVKRFGRPVFTGRVDLTSAGGINEGSWNHYTIDLADYINVEPGVLYKVELGMRKSYALPESELTDDEKRYEEKLQQTYDQNNNWDDPDIYWESDAASVYYSSGFRWEDRDDPAKGAYYSPDKNVSRNIFASDLGLLVKKGEDDVLHVIISDLISALPVSEVDLKVYDYQMQEVASGNTRDDGTAILTCSRRPFLVVATKGQDKNYLKITDGSSLSLSSFDVAGTSAEKGIKAFIYGERDVWRPGDSIFISVFIKNLNKHLPPDHPVQFELINPLEQRTDIQIHRLRGDNLLVFRTKTPADAPTGNYRAEIKTGGVTFTKRIRVETIKPNRLKINLNFSKDILGGTDNITPGSLNVKWLNGATASNLKTSVEYLLKRTVTTFDKYSQYNFDDPATDFYSETVNIYDNNIDEEGNASIIFQPQEDIRAPGMLNALFTVRVKEKGGDESITQKSYKYAPYPVFVGINLPGLGDKGRQLYTDTDNEVEVVTLDAGGKAVNSTVEMTLYKLSYRWWWESDQENLAHYISNQIYKPVLTQRIVTSGGKGTFSFRIDKNDWGRYLIRASTLTGHATGKIVLIDWPWEYGMKSGTDGATQLVVTCDKEKYNPGDEAEISFPAPENARAVITLENATGIIDKIMCATQKGNTVVRFKITPEMAPNIYAYVTVIQPYSQTVNDMPVRLYGIIPLMVEDPATRLYPLITAPSEIRSQQSFSIEVSEKNKKPMVYTLAIVDEGLLDITNYGTPDPWTYFYSREALGVKTWDIYDHVLGAYGGTLERLLATGGDQALVDHSAARARRFTPVVRFLGPYSLTAGGTKTHTLSLPHYTGSVRIMAIAGNEKAFGATDKQMTVKDPLMVLVTAPRVISPGEKAALPVTIFIQDNNIKDISLRAESNDFVRFEENIKNISVSSTGELDTEFTFHAGDKTGISKISVTATGGEETASYEMELAVRNPDPPETRAELQIIDHGEKWETTFNPFGIPGSSSAKLEVSAMPSVNLEKNLDYLLNYPHGCTEQVISEAFPQLWLPELNKDDTALAERVSSNITGAIGLLLSRQMTGGGLALWPGSYQPDNWITSYAGHFILEAERKGYNVSSSFKQKWLDYQKNNSREWQYDNKYRHTCNDQAYRLFTLALAGQPDRGAMNRLRETADIPQLARWLLAAAYAQTGRPEVADDLLDMRMTDTEEEYNHYFYGSALRDKAIILYSLTIMKKEEEALTLLKEISNEMNRGSWYSTQSLAWGLLSYMKWLDMTPDKENTENPVFTISFNGNKETASTGTKGIWSKNLEMEETNNLIIDNTSGQSLYATLVTKGIPYPSDSGYEEKGLSLKADYLTFDLQPVDHRNISHGTDFMMVIQVSNNTFSAVDNIALTQMVPSGWEIRNTRLFEINTGIQESSYDYRDIRDDRINTYFSLNRGERKTFIVILNAAYKGEFYHPSVWCEAMYTANCYARLPGMKVTVDD